MIAHIQYRTIRETHDKALISTSWDLHEIEDADDITISQVGCIHVTNTAGNIHVYPVANVVKMVLRS